jgi:hypothetical protein
MYFSCQVCHEEMMSTKEKVDQFLSNEYMACKKCQHIAKDFIALQDKIDDLEREKSKINGHIQKITFELMCKETINGNDPLIEQLWKYMMPYDEEVKTLSDFWELYSNTLDTFFNLSYLINKYKEKHQPVNSVENKKKLLADIIENYKRYIEMRGWKDKIEYRTADELIQFLTS